MGPAQRFGRARSVSKKWIFVALGGLLLVLAGDGASRLLSDLLRPGAVASGTEPAYVDMDPLAAPVMRGERISRYLYLTLVLQVADENATQRVEGRRAVVRDQTDGLGLTFEQPARCI